MFYQIDLCMDDNLDPVNKNINKVENSVVRVVQRYRKTFRFTLIALLCYGLYKMILLLLWYCGY